MIKLKYNNNWWDYFSGYLLQLVQSKFKTNYIINYYETKFRESIASILYLKNTYIQ